MTNIPTPDPDAIRDPDLRAVVVALNLATEALGRVAGKVRNTRVWLACLALVVLLIPVTYSVQRHQDCERVNDGRDDIRAAIVAVLRGFGPEGEAAAGRATDILRETFPPRDCGGVLP